MTFNRPNPYMKMDRPDGKAHPLDTIARARIPHELAEELRTATCKLEQALENNRGPWFAVEALLEEYRIRRDEILYNIGHEHGFLAGSAHMLSMVRRQPTGTAYHLLAEQVRKQLVVSDLPLKFRLAVLLDAAWGLLSESNTD